MRIPTLIGTIASTLLSFSAFAHTSADPNSKSHDHPTSERADIPAGTQVMLRGETEPGKLACQLYVMQSDLALSPPTAKVMTSLSHQREEPETVTVSQRAERPDMLYGLGENGKDEIAILFSTTPSNWTQATAFNYKWWHRNHFDLLRCRNLKIVTQ